MEQVTVCRAGGSFISHRYGHDQNKGGSNRTQADPKRWNIQEFLNEAMSLLSPKHASPVKTV